MKSILVLLLLTITQSAWAYPSATCDTNCNITQDGYYTVIKATGNATITFSSGGDIALLVVAGGGGGASGGGGAGGVRYFSQYSVGAQAYSIVVGTGGYRGRPSSIAAQDGMNSSFDTIVSSGGGGGGWNTANDGTQNGRNGGSGGGGCGSAGADSSYDAWGGTATPTGQGYGGGRAHFGSGFNLTPYCSGGGGGGGAPGQNQQTRYVAGSGGAGFATTITGSLSYYGGGGGGGCYESGSATPGSGGTGGGGAGTVNNGTATSGTANTGGGGGGSGWGTAQGTGGSGGSGIVIIRYQREDTPPGITCNSNCAYSRDGDYVIVQATGNATVTVGTNLTTDILLVGAGGANGYSYGAGGGGGQVTYVTNYALSSGTYSISIGTGGYVSSLSNTVAYSGGPTTFSTMTALGGGAGGYYYSSSYKQAGQAGYNGGGGAGYTGYTTGGTGTNYNGGSGTNNAGTGGGGGCGGAGGNGDATNGGYGGAGCSYSITGTAVYYGAGGNGRPNRSSSQNGSTPQLSAATNYTGAGGGGDYGTNPASRSGSDGTVIFRYYSPLMDPGAFFNFF